MNVQLITTAPNVGRGANDGAYYPCGLLSIASAVMRNGYSVNVWDQNHGQVSIDTSADVIGIQTPSTLCHRNALQLAEEAKARGKVVVVGGPHASSLADQVLRNRPFIDYVVREKGEEPLRLLMKCLEKRRDLHTVPGLSWRDGGQVVHNPVGRDAWQYDDYAPLPLHVLASGLETYWETFRSRIDGTTDCNFLVFTHFACEYRTGRMRGAVGPEDLILPDGRSRYCSFCSLQDIAGARSSERILREVQLYLETYGVRPGSRVMLKCYGDNIGPHVRLVEELADRIEQCGWWRNFDIGWTFYCQSSRVTERLMRGLQRIGTRCLFIGFDSADDRVQRLNGLGTNMKTHQHAVDLCEQYGIKIQGASVVGQIGETLKSLEATYRFFATLLRRGVLERINSAILFVIPGSAAYQLLVQREPWLQTLDLLPTEQVRELWIQHFCPGVTHELLDEYARKIDALSPGPHSHMGYGEE